MSDSPISQRYWDQAKRLRQQAARARSAEIGKQLEDIAHQYDLLADSNEQREMGQSGRD